MKRKEKVSIFRTAAYLIVGTLLTVWVTNGTMNNYPPTPQQASMDGGTAFAGLFLSVFSCVGGVVLVHGFAQIVELGSTVTARVLRYPLAALAAMFGQILLIVYLESGDVQQLLTFVDWLLVPLVVGFPAAVLLETRLYISRRLSS